MSVLPPNDQNTLYQTNAVLVNEIDAVQDAPPVEDVEASARLEAPDPIGVMDEIDTTPVDMAQVTMEARGLARDAAAERFRRARAVDARNRRLEEQEAENAENAAAAAQAESEQQPAEPAETANLGIGGPSDPTESPQQIQEEAASLGLASPAQTDESVPSPSTPEPFAAISSQSPESAQPAQTLTDESDSIDISTTAQTLAAPAQPSIEPYTLPTFGQVQNQPSPTQPEATAALAATNVVEPAAAQPAASAAQPVTAAAVVNEIAPASTGAAAPTTAAVPQPSTTAAARATRPLGDPSSALDFLSTTNSRSVTELLATFENYDNSQAVTQYNNYLTVFTRYTGSVADNIQENNEANMRAAENATYQYLGISHYGTVTRQVREGISNAIDRWYVGEGVFTPEMLNYSSGTGFRFSPVSPNAQQALLYRNVLSTYDRNQIAAYLREMARLTPFDFVFYDPTGLEALTLEQRREFLRLVDSLLADAEIQARAADLQYAFTEDGQLDFDYLDEQLALEQQRLVDYINSRRDAYGQMLNMYQRYGLATISAAFV